MKKQRKATHKAGKAGVATSRSEHGGAVDGSRRRLLRHIRNGAIAAGVLSIGGWGLAHAYQTHVERHDLSVIGNGIPTVVQIHDPQCPICRALQKETLRAAGAFDDGALQVRVANIRSTEGRALADRHGVPHVTLLLFDGQGAMQQVLRGPQEADDLRHQFRAHLTRSAARS